MEKKITYSAVILDEKSRGILRQTFSSGIPDGWEWVAHHMTICMGPIKDAGIREMIGQTKTLIVTAVGGNDKAIAIKVAGFYSERPIPHITLAVNRKEGGKPFHSNDIKGWQDYDYDLRLTGVVSEVEQPFTSAPLNESITDVNTLPFIGDVKALGGKIYQVGGAVRDKFLGKDSKDLDILIQGVPADKLKSILEKYGRVDMVGASFGVIKFRANGSTEEIDIAIPRTERKIGAGYTGFEVTADHNLPVEKDLERRDFTINSIAKDLDGNIIDPYKGQEDLQNKVIRVTNPVAFKEDPLRMLRAVQFASRFGFEIETNTMKLIKQNAEAIKEISPERILMEFEKIVEKGNPFVGAQLLKSSGLGREIFGFELDEPDSYFEKVKKMSEFIFLFLYQKVANPSQFFKTRLKGDINATKEITALVKSSTVTTTKIDTFKSVFDVYKTAAHMIDSFVVREVFGLGAAIDAMREQNMPFSFKQMALNGDDLIKLGVPEGPLQGKLLNNLLIGIYSGKLRNEYEALATWVRQQPLRDAVTTIKNRF